MLTIQLYGMLHKGVSVPPDPTKEDGGAGGVSVELESIQFAV